MLKQWQTKIICVSGKARHGKDTVADFLHTELVEQGHKVLLIHYADLLKFICKTYFLWDGKKDDAGRTLLQRVGTDVVRAQEPDFWVNSILKVLSFFPNEWDYVIIPDCRFPNELQAVQKEYPAYHVRVTRGADYQSPLTIEQQQHPSETALDTFYYDVLIENSGSLDDLHAKVSKLVKDGYFE